jgi:hypothetical protein
MRQRPERQPRERSFCALVAPILLTTSDALVLSSVTHTDDWCREPLLYEKSYPTLHEKQPFSFTRNGHKNNGEECLRLSLKGRKQVENHTRGYDLS